MRALLEAEFRSEAKRAFESVFSSSNPFEAPFAAPVESRALLFPMHYTMEKPLARAIRKAAMQLNEGSFYLSVLERPAADEQDRAYHWHLGFNELDRYESLAYPFVLENAVYSDRGTWGIMFSHEHHALLGGPAHFVQEVTKKLSASEKQMQNFVEAWKHNHERFGSNLDWLRPLLQHICGDEHADEVMQQPV
jgi:hypothetical protein